jgi:hypothetical protein
MSFIRFLVVGLSSGILFAFADGLVNQNEIAKAMFEYYKVIARTGTNYAVIIGTFMLYGFVMTWIFEILYSALPGKSGMAKGTSFGIITWFFRVFMYAITQWLVIAVPAKTMAYLMLAGLAEMLVMGWFYGIFMNPEKEHKSLL